MEKITDFFNDVKDRLSNPLFSSFIIAWLVINWQIPIALFFYNTESLKIDGYKSYIDLIASKYSSWNYIVYPLLLAFAYTFIFPFLRNGILAFQAWIRTWGNDLNLKISRKGKVPTERFVQLRKKYLEQTKTLEQVFAEEGRYVEENKELNLEKTKLTTQNNSLSADLSNWRSMNDVNVLYGEWDYLFKPSENDLGTNYRLSIMSGQIHMYADASKSKKIEVYNIQDFFCNPMARRLCFVLSPFSDGKRKILHNLTYPNGIAELTGTEDHVNLIVYRKLLE
jgi:hypothetical protein